MITTVPTERKIRQYVSVVRADHKFRRYKSEKHEPVRDIEVKGDELQRLRQAREMLRSMTPEQVKQIIEWHKNLTVFEALILAKKQGYLIVPNDVHDRILNETSDENYLKQNYPVWTGTLVIYEAPNKPFKDKIVFTWEDDRVQHTITFNVPKRYQGKGNCALVVEHPDFELVKVGDNSYEIRVADEVNVHLIKKFPKEDGWYLTDNKHKIAIRKSFFGREVNGSNKDARRLSRKTTNAYCGLLRRDYGDFDFYWRHGVGLVVQPSGRFGVAMVPLAIVAKQSDQHVS